MNTHTFKLTCGVECEVRELTGKEQRLLTEQGAKKIGEGIDKMLKSIIVRIGSVTTFGDDLLGKLLTADRKLILFEVRKFSISDGSEDDNLFKFDFPYINQRGIKSNHELEVDISEGVPTKPLMVDSEEGLVEACYKEYEDIKMHDEYTLPSGKKVVWTLLNGAGQKSILMTKKEERSSHSMLKARNVREYIHSKDGNEVLTSCIFDNLSFKDIEALRKRIKAIEPEVDTSLIFEHPEAEYKSAEEKEVTIEMTNTIAFFFPSGAI